MSLSHKESCKAGYMYFSCVFSSYLAERARSVELCDIRVTQTLRELSILAYGTEKERFSANVRSNLRKRGEENCLFKTIHMLAFLQGIFIRNTVRNIIAKF